jgi:dihydroorotase-like cyclic amidohydrolase
MASFRDPGFQDRIKLAAEAKQKALEKLRSKPPVDEAELEARRVARVAKEAAEAEKRAAKLAARQAEAEAKAAAKAAAIAANAPKPPPKMPTPEEMKAARDARYAARKAR